MVRDRQLRAARLLKERRLACAVFADPASTVYLTGYVPPVETGPSPFEGGPPLVVLTADGGALLIVSDIEEPAARGRATVDEVIAYRAYSPSENLPREDGYREALMQALDKARFRGGALGIEGAVPHHATAWVAQVFRGAEFTSVSECLNPIRMVKDSDEVAAIRKAADISVAGQRAVRQLVRPGLSEVELFAAVRGQMEQAFGRRLPVLADLVSGPRSAEVGGAPSSRTVGEGEVVLVDLVPCVDGYWGDTCVTVFLGPAPEAELRQAHRVVVEALQKGIEAVKPGMTASELDAIVRGHVRKFGYDYPHHTGHGVGTTWHEGPRIVAGDRTVLRPGMVIALEPGVYVDGRFGVRVEDLLLVTESGAEVLSHHDKSLIVP
ncbi:M24 family metallopeptidase [Caldinitratiruptor microaerophilus]|uniref:Peptidase M24 n=1 Tax=Caldinitratiruptor microaerophilus TaxID=671077 RepID=A0AA35G9B6_9FIRM|nr:Xaa-Pro peptidase family protein [Caldinitratiruptor microaerophilus]BDG60124.1 peptidase M24 [Caldinitratiruptor microaerophilus]